MEETIVIPSPNWFQVSILGASEDGWLIYGGPSKSLCFLEPLPSETIGAIDSKQRFKAHISHRAHKEKIVSVDLSPEWPIKRNIVTGGHDGVVKEWCIEQNEGNWSLSYLHCHEEHSVQKEEVVGVCYSTHTHAVSVGNTGSLCRWDLNTNVVKRFATHLRNFKPTCISSSPHKHLHVAVGTRQGVVLVIDISSLASKLIYKVRAQDDEINRVSWCPQYAVSVDKKVSNEKSKAKSNFTAGSRMDRIRNDQEPSEALEKALEEQKEKTNDEKHQKVIPKDEKHQKGKQPKDKKDEKIKTKDKKENLDKTDEEESIVPEDDMFDIYTDHAADEFGHKKYEPEEVLVKVKEAPKADFLVECEKLKAEILKIKDEPEESIESLVEAMDKAHFKDDDQKKAMDKPESTENREKKNESQEYAHLLASIGKYGSVKIWTQTGKLLASCNVVLYKKDTKDKTKGTNWPTLHWFKPDSLLIADGKNQVLETNPLKIDSKNKLEWQVVHSLHRRGLFFLSSNAPRVQTPELLSSPAADSWVVWSVGQDRYVISYSMKERKKIEMWSSSGSFLFGVEPCSYDAGKIAIAAGDGSIRVWETHTTNELEDQLSTGVMSSYWQNVQGKIFTLAWHPSKENCLAFGTAEARVGILDASGSCEKPAKIFPNFFKHGVYSLSWGEGMNLYACGNGVLALFQANKIEQKGKEIAVVVEGQAWEISSVLWTTRGLAVGSVNGGVALLDHEYRVICASFVYMKMIYTIAWHPKQTTNSEEESKYQNYIAICAMDKEIAIMEYDDRENVKQLKKLQPLSGHEGAVLHAAWSPHRDALLLSTSQDATVRIWNVLEGCCVAIFGGHSVSAQGAAWGLQPRAPHRVLSAGGDGCLRLWDMTHYPPEHFKGVKKEAPKKKKGNRAREERSQIKNNKIVKPSDTHADLNIEVPPSTSENVATTEENRIKGSKIFLLPDTASQMKSLSYTSIKKYLMNYIEDNNKLDMQELIKTCPKHEREFRFLKMFGTINDVNELLETEAKLHLEKNYYESYLMLLFFSGKVDDMIQFASENNLLDSYLLSLTPSVSFKYWKDTTYLYLAQLERWASRGHGDWATQKFYGGITYRKMFTLLSTHDIKGCIDVMLEALLFKEAYILCRLRHVDSIAEEVLLKWAKATLRNGELMMAAILQLVRGDLSEAAMTLGRANHISSLKLASQLAKLSGQHTFAEHIDAKIAVKETEVVSDSEEELEKLPSRAEAIIKAESCDNDYDFSPAKVQNGVNTEEINTPNDLTNGKVPVNDDVVE